MDEDKLQELETRSEAELDLEKMRARMTILFSDVKGSTAYAEKHGDMEYMSMINRHNSILFPVIEENGGRVVKTLGDAILACFDDPVAAVKAGAGMQRALAQDRRGRPEKQQIHVRVGLHTGFGLIKDGDVFGDVVNAASRIQHQAEGDQVLITDVLLEPAKAAGFQCARMGRAELKGKDEPIDVYAVAWSDAASQQLIEQVQAQYERRLKDLKRQHEQLEDDFEKAREQWRGERRSLTAEIEELEGEIERVRESAREQLSEDLQSELRFQLEEAYRARQRVEDDLAAAHEKFAQERNTLKAQIAGMQGTVVEAMERSNNPARMAFAVREQVEARVAEAKQDWNLQWEAERRRLNAEIERLKKAGGRTDTDEKKEAARRALLEKLGKIPAGSGGPGVKTADQWEREFQEAKFQWETEREQMAVKLKRLETELQRTQDTMRTEIFNEMRSEYEPKLIESKREAARLDHEVQRLTRELETERQRLNSRISQLEQTIPEAQEAARKQVSREMQDKFEAKMEEAGRLKSRLERKHADAFEEWESERRRMKKQIATLEDQLKDAREAAYKAQKVGRPVTPE